MLIQKYLIDIDIDLNLKDIDSKLNKIKSLLFLLLNIDISQSP